MGSLSLDKASVRLNIGRESSSEQSTTVMIISDDVRLVHPLEAICEFLDLPVEYLQTEADIDAALQQEHPLAVVVDVDGICQDGYNIMMVAARFNRNLPVLLLTGGASELIGAADAIQEMCGLTNLTTVGSDLSIAKLVDFFFTAKRIAGLTSPLAV